MNLRHAAVALVIAVSANVLVVLPFASRLDGISIDSLFWLRDKAFGPRHDPASSRTVIVALDEETYRRPPFEQLPKVMWTRQIATVTSTSMTGDPCRSPPFTSEACAPILRNKCPASIRPPRPV